MYNTVKDMQAELEKTVAARDPGCMLHSPRLTISITMPSIVGVNQHERFTPQTLNVLLSIEKSSTKITDLDTTNIQMFLKKIISREKPFLIERMCYLMACELLSNFDTLMTIALTIEKPEALKHARKVYASIRMERWADKARQGL